MNSSLNRRQFLQRSALLGIGLSALGSTFRSFAADSPARKVVVGVMGVNGRGMNHIDSFLAQPGVEIGYICDVDSRAIAKAIAAVEKKQQRKPQGVTDFRRMLDDKNLDAISIATPNHWHAPATILACSAGKHVYVEKPGSHNPREAELMVEAARKHNRYVQMGNQRRSWPWVQEAIARLHAGEIGKVTFARCWYNNARNTIGRGKPAVVPDWLNYELWQGPAPERPFKDNLVHYNWHWHWHWGNGELGNNGIHALDLARWGLQVDAPRRVTCGGGRYQFEDDQETPDIYVTTFDFGDKGACWEGHSSHPRGFEGEGFGVNFYGDKGHIIVAGNNYKICDPNGKERVSVKGQWNDADHFGNFIDCIRNGGKLNAEIGDGQKSTLLCHLGNIAYRTGHTIDFDPIKRKIIGDRAANALWSRKYRRGWEPKV